MLVESKDVKDDINRIIVKVTIIGLLIIFIGFIIGKVGSIDALKEWLFTLLILDAVIWCGGLGIRFLVKFNFI